MNVAAIVAVIVRHAGAAAPSKVLARGTWERRGNGTAMALSPYYLWESSA